MDTHAPAERPFDALDAIFLIGLIGERDIALANEEDQRFLNDFADDIHEGHVHHVTLEEKARLYRCAREVGLAWVDMWL